MGLVAVVGAVGVLGLAWCGLEGSGSEVGAPRLRTAPVERRALAEVVEATGRLAAPGRFAVTAAVESRIEAILVQVGETVAEGQALARLDARKLAYDVAALQAARAAARARAAEAASALEAARVRVGRLERLEAGDRASEVELEAAKTDLRAAEAAARASRSEIDAASARASAARLAAERAELSAPRAGVVLRVRAEVGQAVGPGGPPLFEMADGLDPLEVRAEVSEADIGRIAVGQSGRFEVPAFPGELFTGTVARIGLVPDAEGAAAAYPVVLRAPNPEGRLRPGMTAAVRFEVARVAEALVVREAALRYAPPGAEPAPPRSRVFVRRGETRLVPVPVERGLADGAFVEVRPEPGARLEAGDEVVIGESLSGVDGVPGLTLGGGG